ncbi:hypothetical protein [Chitinophaga sp.]|uniref:hypothetical protein n=1 Tax=Chitinophaga sp. TaxID=1869181 RepID=UPI0031DFCE63
MSIDIHISNYEEFLYSYVDGELNAAETAALEAFLDAHPHLRQELEVLMATRLVPEKEVVFDAKSSLYRSSTVNLQNYEPFLLSYIDGELNVEEAAAVEQFAATHPAVQQELEIWKATRLQPDLNVRFENKAALYRHTATVRRMRPAYWWAAAAAVVAGAVFFLLPATDGPVNQPPVVAVTPAPQAGDEPAAPPAAAPGADTRIAQADQPDAAKGQDVVQPAAPQSRSANRTVAPARKPAQTLAQQTPQVDREAARPPQSAAVAANVQPVKPEADRVVLASITPEQPARQEAPAIKANPNFDAAQKKASENEALVAQNRPSSVQQQPEQALATAPPAANPPGELIMSVTGNGIESKVLDKVTNVARLFSRKRNK